MTIDEFIAKIETKKVPLPQDQLEAFERELGERLPEDYRRFICACNGGQTGPTYWFVGPTPEGEKADAGVGLIRGFRKKQSGYSLLAVREDYQGRIPKGLIWIIDDSFGNGICLGVTGPYRGKVYFWNHEEEPDPDAWDGRVETAGNLQLLANSFTDFIAGLSEPEDDRGVDVEAESLVRLWRRLLHFLRVLPYP